MSAYMVVHAVVSDPARFIEYAKAEEDLAVKFGAAYLVRGLPAQILEGHWPHNRRTVISRWPTRAALSDFWNAPEYAAIREMREDAAACDIAIYDGIDA